MKRILFVSNLQQGKNSDILHEISVNSHHLRAKNKQLGISAAQVFSQHHILTLLEGEQDAVECCFQDWLHQTHQKDSSLILSMDIDRRIATAPMRFIPVNSKTGRNFMSQLRHQCLGCLNVKTATDLKRWREFASWGDIGLVDTPYHDSLLSLQAWPTSEQLYLDDDTMVVCAVLINRPLPYQTLVSRKLVTKTVLDQLLMQLDDLGLLLQQSTKEVLPKAS